jgi:Big-like domain-containing protein
MIRFVQAGTGIISTVAGTSVCCNRGDDGPATSAFLNSPHSVALDGPGNLYFAEFGRIREVNKATGIIQTVAGNGSAGTSGDGVPATDAEVDAGPLAVDPAGNIYVGSNTGGIRKVDVKTGLIHRIAGANYFGLLTEGVSARLAGMCPDGFALDSTGTLYYADYCYYKVRAVTFRAPTPAISLTASASTAFLSNAVIFTATFSGDSGTPTGTATLYDGSTELETVTLANGAATFTTSSLSAGAHSISAAYSGDAHFSPATSTAVSETIEDFTIAAPTGSASSATVHAGGQASYSLVLSPSGGTGMAADIVLSVSGLPAGATAGFSPAAVSANSAATSVTLTVKTAAQAAAARSPFVSKTLSVTALALLFFTSMRRVRRNARRIGMAFIAFLLFGTLATAFFGCGGGGGNPGGGGTTNPQSYTVTVTATSGGLSHATTLTLTVQ